MRIMIVLLALCLPAFASKKPVKAPEPSALDRYVAAVEARPPGATSTASPGSLYSQSSRLGDAFRDLRANQVDDLVTVVVSDRASAVTTGTTNTSRKSSAKAGIQALAGITKAAGPLANLTGLSSDQQLQGQGTTTRGSTLTTTLSARVTHVLPNGNLVIEGIKDVVVNSEHQAVTVRGIVRPQDLSSANQIPSDRLANLEILINGKGVVADSVKRPFILYRILLALLPF